jgi:hypothetical protein
MLNLLSKLSVIGSELWEDVSDLLVTIRCSRSLSCFRFSISFCKQMAHINVKMLYWSSYKAVRRNTCNCSSSQLKMMTTHLGVQQIYRIYVYQDVWEFLFMNGSDGLTRAVQ